MRKAGIWLVGREALRLTSVLGMGGPGRLPLAGIELPSRRQSLNLLALKHAHQ